MHWADKSDLLHLTWFLRHSWGSGACILWLFKLKTWEQWFWSICPGLVSTSISPARGYTSINLFCQNSSLIVKNLQELKLSEIWYNVLRKVYLLQSNRSFFMQNLRDISGHFIFWNMTPIHDILKLKSLQYSSPNSLLEFWCRVQVKLQIFISVDLMLSLFIYCIICTRVLLFYCILPQNVLIY